ncbi:hypothetical protein FKP32DRAFT_1558968 [Trametes sanguinea]|nr:hypothetical protein FKP32DRAFT_1558968 [Trametes sanguinea]
MSQQIEALLAGLSPTSSWLPTWLSNEIFEQRIEPRLDFFRNASACSLSRIPTSAQWGNGRLASVLCMNDVPLQIHAVGELQTIIATADLSSEIASTMFRLELLRDCDKASFAAALRKSRGITAVDIPFHFECTRIERHTDKIFSDVFDGRQTPTNAEASEMPSLTLQDLRLGDIVQIQTMLVREHSTPWSGQQQLWWDYTVKFAPVHVTLLARKTL